MSDPIEVSILGDSLFCQRMRALLKSASDIAVVSEAQEGQDAIALIHKIRPDVVLLAVSASCTGSLQTVRQICELCSQIKIIVFDEDSEEQLALEAFRKGALGYLVGKAQPAEISAAIRAVVRGKAILSPGIAGRILDEFIQERRH